MLKDYYGKDASALLLKKLYLFDMDGTIYLGNRLFGGVKEAKFRRQVVPGDLLRLEVEIIKVKGPIGVGKALATVNGEKAVSAEITFAIK